MKEWTREQRDAIESRNETLLVAAGAGSGKTAVLAERIVRLILEDRVDVTRILVMTFTRAAAASMRQRIGEGLETADPGADPAWRELQREKLPGAEISTIHSYCQRLLRRYFTAAETDPAAVPIDEAGGRLLADEELDGLLEDLYAGGPDWFRDLVEYFSPDRQDQGLRRVIQTVAGAMEGAPDPEGWLRGAVAHYRPGADYWGSVEAARVRRCARMQLRRLEGQLDRCQAVSASACPYYGGTVAADRAWLAGLWAAEKQGLPALFGALGALTVPSLSGKPRSVDPADTEVFKEARAAAKKTLGELQVLAEGDPEEKNRQLQRMHGVLERLSEVVRAYRARVALRKTRERVVTFGDLEQGALRVLSDPAVREQVRSTYRAVFVDEYQDTSRIQEAIIQASSGPGNLFLVGDAKQSIYRFRQAAPEILQTRRRQIRQHRAGAGRLVYLSRNFRSSRPVIETVNEVFGHLMREETGGIAYTGGEELVYGAPLDGETAPVEFVFLEPGEAPGSGDVGESTARQREARCAAGLLQARHRTMIRDRETGKERPLDWGDMVVLLRNREGWADGYREALRAAGIPVHLDSPPGYFEAQEIGVLLQVLRLVDNRRQDYPWVSFLRSPLVGMDDEALARLFGGRGEEPLWAVSWDHPDPGPRLEKAREWIRRWQVCQRSETVTGLLERILADTHWQDMVGAMPDGAQRRANLGLLLDRSAEYDRQSCRGLRGFLETLEKLRKEELDPGVASTAPRDQDVVRILTIHRAKGLEFPLVLLGGMGKRFRGPEESAEVLVHRDLGLGIRYVDTASGCWMAPGLRRSLTEAEKRENRAEELRLLYVAMTRAQNRLLCLGTLAAPDPAAEPAPPAGIGEGSSWAQWLHPLVSREPAPHRTVLVASAAGAPDPDPVPRWEENRQRLRRALAPDGEGAPAPAADPAEECRALRGILPAKLAVTDVWRLETGGVRALLSGRRGRFGVPRFRQVPGEADGLRRGVAVHRVMAGLDLGRVSEGEIRAQVEEMVAREILEESEAALVDPAAVARFFASPLGRRLRASSAVHREVPFTLAVPAAAIFPEARQADIADPILLQGVIDLFFREKDGLVLVDYKTDRQPFGDGEDPALDAYRRQMELYRQALETLGAGPVTQTLLYSFARGETLEVEAKDGPMDA